jgi:hypothetical protein
MAFRVGQKVVCVDDDFADLEAYTDSDDLITLAAPSKGTVYTIRSFKDDDAVRLVELLNPICQGFTGLEEPSFYLFRFRPVTEHKTDISMLTALLVPGTKIRETV